MPIRKRFFIPWSKMWTKMDVFLLCLMKLFSPFSTEADYFWQSKEWTITFVQYSTCIWFLIRVRLFRRCLELIKINWKHFQHHHVSNKEPDFFKAGYFLWWQCSCWSIELIPLMPVFRMGFSYLIKFCLWTRI